MYDHVITSDTRQQSSKKSSILSTLAQHFPFVFDLLRRHNPQLNEIERNDLHENASPCEGLDSRDSSERGNGIDVNGIAEDSEKYPKEFKAVVSSNDNEFYASRFDCFPPFVLVHLMMSASMIYVLSFPLLSLFGFCRDYDNESEQSKVGSSETGSSETTMSASFYNAITEGSAPWVYFSL